MIFNKNDLVTFNGEEFRVLKKCEISNVSVKSYLLYLCAEGKMERIKK